MSQIQKEKGKRVSENAKVKRFSNQPIKNGIIFGSQARSLQLQ